MVTWHPHRHNASHRRLRTYGGKETAVAQGPRVVRLGTPGRTGASEDRRFSRPPRRPVPRPIPRWITRSRIATSGRGERGCGAKRRC